MLLCAYRINPYSILTTAITDLKWAQEQYTIPFFNNGTNTATVYLLQLRSRITFGTPKITDLRAQNLYADRAVIRFRVQIYHSFLRDISRTNLCVRELATVAFILLLISMGHE